MPAAVPCQRRRDRLRRMRHDGVLGIRRVPTPRLPPRAFHPPLDQRRRPPELPHAPRARHRARRGQVRAHQLGRGPRHHRERVHTHQGDLRQRGRLRPGMLRRRAERDDEQPVLPPVQPVRRRDQALRQLLERRHLLRSAALYVRKELGRPLVQHPGRRRARGPVRQRPGRHPHGGRRCRLRPERGPRAEARQDHRHRPTPQRPGHEPGRRVDPDHAGHGRRARSGHRARAHRLGPRGRGLPAHLLRWLRRGDPARGCTREQLLLRLYHGYGLRHGREDAGMGRANHPHP